MPLRPGDATVELEVIVRGKHAKSFSVECTWSEVEADIGKHYFLPFSQIEDDAIQPDPEGRVLVVVSEWWYKKRGDFEKT